MLPCSYQPALQDAVGDLKSYEWYLLEKLPDDLLSSGQQNLRLGPFASEQECRAIREGIRNTPGFGHRNLLVHKRGKRRHKRIEKKLPVAVRRVEDNGSILHASTVDISSSGARLAGVKAELKKGEVVELQFNDREAAFQVVWIGSGATAEQVGVECLEPESNFWNLDMPVEPDAGPLFQQIETARQVQSMLFPREQPALRTLEYVGHCVPAFMVGGDYYDFLDLGPGQVGFVLADVAGKGIAAALLMANLHGHLHSQCGTASQDPARMLDSVNRHFFNHTDTNRYATLFFGCYNDSRRHLRYINCGHNPPLLLRRSGGVERLSATATVLGLFQEWTGSVAEVELQEGDILGIYTDGVTEVTGNNGDEFGEAGLLQVLRQNRELPAIMQLESIHQAVQQFSSGEQADDLTLVIARVR